MNAIPNRRGLLLGALTAGALASVAAIPEIAAAERPDPVFGLVEAHKAAWTRLLETEDRTDDHEALEEAGRAVDIALDGHSDYLPTLLRSSLLRSPLLLEGRTA